MGTIRIPRSRWAWVRRLTHDELHHVHARSWRLWRGGTLSPGQAGVWDEILREAQHRAQRQVRQDRCQREPCLLFAPDVLREPPSAEGDLVRAFVRAESIAVSSLEGTQLELWDPTGEPF